MNWFNDKKKARLTPAELVKIANDYFKEDRDRYNQLKVEGEVVGGSISIVYTRREEKR